MKLPTPRTIHQNISEERRRDIEQGIILARRLDTLRNDLSIEEKNFAIFKDAQTKGLQEEITNLGVKKNEIELEIERLERERQELLRPVTIKWEEVNKKEQELKDKENKLNDLKTQLTLKKQELDDREKWVSQEEERITKIKQEIYLLAERTSQSSLNAQAIFSEAKDKEREVNLKVKKKEREMKQKLLGLEMREKKIEEREYQLELNEKEIINEKIRLADQRATLERAMNRIKK